MACVMLCRLAVSTDSRKNGKMPGTHVGRRMDGGEVDEHDPLRDSFVGRIPRFGELHHPLKHIVLSCEGGQFISKQHS